MAKDKPAKRISMKEHIKSKENATKETAKPNFADGMQSSYDKEHNEKLKVYNTTVTEIDPTYAKVTPVADVLVRVFVHPMEEENGVLKPNSIPVEGQTKSGVGVIGYMENSFPYSQKAVVVSTPKDNETFNVGDIVYLAASQIKAKAVGKGDNAMIMIPNKFVHPDEANKYPIEQPLPIDPSDSNYGYLLVRPFDIKAIL